MVRKLWLPAICSLVIGLSSANAASPSNSPLPHPEYTPAPAPSPARCSSAATIISGNVTNENACGGLFSNPPPASATEFCAGGTHMADSQPRRDPNDMTCHYLAWQEVGGTNPWVCSLSSTCLSYIVSATCMSPDDGLTPDQRISTWYDRGTRCGDVISQATQFCQTACCNGAYTVSNCNVQLTF